MLKRMGEFGAMTLRRQILECHSPPKKDVPETKNTPHCNPLLLMFPQAECILSFHSFQSILYVYSTKKKNK
jgi:hypothetical protein